MQGIPGIPVSSPVFRIQRRHVIERSPRAEEHAVFDRSAVRLHGQALTPFTIPTAHMWCLRMEKRDDTPHVVLFHDADNARCMVRAIASFEKREKRLPRRYDDMRALFRAHYRGEGASWGKGKGPVDGGRLHVQVCEMGRMFEWAMVRRIGILAIGRVYQEEGDAASVPFQVPVTVYSPDPASDFSVGLTDAFLEDFGWQMLSEADDV